MNRIKVIFFNVCFLLFIGIVYSWTGVNPTEDLKALTNIVRPDYELRLTPILEQIENTIKGNMNVQESGGIDIELAAQYFAEAEAIFKIDEGKLWRISLSGPILILPLKRVKISFDPSAQVPLGEMGRVYPNIKITDVWGVINVTSGALVSLKSMRAAVKADVDPIGNPIMGDGWSLYLKKDWQVVPSNRKGDLTLQPKEKLTVKKVLTQAKRLASSEGELIWPGFDLTRYVELRRNETTGSLYLALSNELKKVDPEFIMTISDSQTQEQSMAENLDLVFHEAFHCFQHDPKRSGAPWRVELPKSLFKYGAISARDLAGFYLESILLRRALFAEDQISFIAATRQFVAIRRQRHAGMASEMIEYEIGAELNEGLAKYVGMRATLLGIDAHEQGKLDLSLLERKPRLWMSSRFNNLEKMQEIIDTIRRGLYSTGAIQAFILDKLMPEWKIHVQEKAIPLQDLIADALEAKEKEDSKIAREARDKEDFNSIFKDIKTILVRTRAKNLSQANSILDFDGWKIIINMNDIGDLATLGIAPNRVAIVDMYKRIHQSFVMLGMEGIFTARFNKPVLEDEIALKYFSHTRPGEIPAVTLDGNELSLDEPGQFKVQKQATLKADQIEITLEAGHIEVQDQTVVLIVAPKKRGS